MEVEEDCRLSFSSLSLYPLIDIENYSLARDQQLNVACQGTVTVEDGGGGGVEVCILELCKSILRFVNKKD